MNKTAYRLPTFAAPRSYDVHLDARLGRDAFHGRLGIDLDLAESHDTLELHARNLAVSDACLTAGGTTSTATVTVDPESEMIALHFPSALPVGAAHLDLAFAGEVGQGLTGLYLAQDGAAQVLCTQCEATDARAIFPCFDEPAFKACFAFTIRTADDVMVLANGPLLSATSEEAGSKTWRFAATKPMSSYLVAFVIGDIAGTPEEVVAGTPLRVWGMRGKEAMGAFAQEWTAQLLPWYEDYFGVPYHYDKYDQVAVPGFAAGAMENCGLVLFRQQALLMNPGTTSWPQEKGIAGVVAHEFAHMWFGDLVTMRWWDDLWLNEAFAEWMAHKVTGALRPDYEVWVDFRLDKDSALRTDALASTHPIYTPIATPAEAEELFDVITYVKGCAVLRMLEGFLGEDAFRAGLRTYMQEFKESNAAGADLWRHLQQASHQPVTQIMESWILESGYPLLHVKQSGEGAETVLHLRQERFLSSPAAERSHDPLWPVPVVIQYEDRSGVQETRLLLTEREGHLPLPVEGPLLWCYANGGDQGFYRVNQDAAMLAGLLAHRDRLDPAAQMGLLSDQWALVRAAICPITSFLDTLAALSHSDNRNVLAQVVRFLHSVQDLVAESGDTAAQERFRAWVAGIFRPKLATLGFAPRPGETRNETQARVAVIEAMTALACDPAALHEAATWADREATDPTAVDPNLAGVFIGAVASAGDPGRFERNVAVYQQRKAQGASPQQTNRYLYTLPMFENPDLVERTLGLLDTGVLPKEALMPVLRQMLGQRHSRLAAWAYMQGHWSRIQQVGGMTASALIEATGQLPADKKGEIVAFYDKHLTGMAPKSYARALESLDQLAEFKARTRDELLAWVRQH